MSDQNRVKSYRLSKKSIDKFRSANGKLPEIVEDILRPLCLRKFEDVSGSYSFLGRNSDLEKEFLGICATNDIDVICFEFNPVKLKDVSDSDYFRVWLGDGAELPLGLFDTAGALCPYHNTHSRQIYKAILLNPKKFDISDASGFDHEGKFLGESVLFFSEKLVKLASAYFPQAVYQPALVYSKKRFIRAVEDFAQESNCSLASLLASAQHNPLDTQYCQVLDVFKQQQVYGVMRKDARVEKCAYCDKLSGTSGQQYYDYDTLKESHLHYVKYFKYGELLCSCPEKTVISGKFLKFLLNQKMQRIYSTVPSVYTKNAFDKVDYI